MNAQELFYILGSIVFGLAVLFLIVLVITIVTIKKQVEKTTARINAVSSEIQGFVHAGKEYTSTLGKGFLGTLAFRIIKAFLKRR